MQTKIAEFCQINKDNDQKVRERITQMRTTHKERLHSQTNTVEPSSNTPMTPQSNTEGMEIDQTLETSASQNIIGDPFQTNYTQAPLFDDPTEQEQTQKETKRKHEQIVDEETSTVVEEEEPSEKRPKIVSDAAVYELIEVIKDDRNKNKEHIAKLVESLNEERKLNAKLSNMVDQEISHRKQLEKKFHDRIGEMDTTLKTFSEDLK